MWVRFKRSHIIKGKRFCIGRVLKVTNDYADDLINAGLAEEYKGSFPPKKLKTDFFKPKNVKMVRAKFTVESNELNSMGDCHDIKLRAVHGDDNPENKEFFKWTPGGQISLGVVRSATAEKFTVGKSYYVDFTEVE